MYPVNYYNKPLYIEAEPNINSIFEAEKTGLYNTWNIERIKSAFNFGNGTVKDFLDYAKSNRCYCNIFDLSTGKKIN